MIVIRPLMRGDLDLLADWFAQPHVRAWWGPPEEEMAMVRSDLEGVGAGFEMWIASVEGVPFGYLQDGPPEGAEEPYYQGLEPGARVIDLLIGPPSHLGRGLAAPMLRAHAADLRAAGAPALYIDPDARNERAVRAYRRAGFTEVARHLDAGEETIVMRHA